MTPTFRLGRIRGIAIGIHWSLPVLAVLVAVGLGGERFPNEARGYSDTAYALAGATAAVLFFGSVLAHELSHGLVARRERLTVDSITLGLLGGVTRIEGETPSPGGELRVSGSGPLTSLVLGLVFVAVAAVVAPGEGAHLVEVVARWLGVINLALAAFNVLPGAPLDGGRLLHAFVWWRTGDRMRATAAASRGGRMLGYLLVVGGIAEFAYTNAAGTGLWLAFIGWYLVSAAKAEESQEAVKWALDGVRIADVMTADPFVAPGWYTVDAFIEGVAMAQRHSTFPVQDWEGNLAGVVTLGRLRGVPPTIRSATRVIDVACPLAEVTIARPDEPVTSALERTGPSCADGRILVMESDRLVGIVSPSDIVAVLQRAGLKGPA